MCFNGEKYRHFPHFYESFVHMICSTNYLSYFNSFSCQELANRLVNMNIFHINIVPLICCAYNVLTDNVDSFATGWYANGSQGDKTMVVDPSAGDCFEEVCIRYLRLLLTSLLK